MRGAFLRGLYAPVALAWVLAAAGLAAGADPPKTETPGVVTAAPVIEGAKTDPYLVELKVKNVPRGTGIVWDVFPLDTKVSRATVRKRIVKTEQAVLIAGPKGEYEVLCRLVSIDAKTGDTNIDELPVTVTITAGSPDPKPGPGPNPPPDPTPDPERKGVSYQIVWVEETDEAAAGRGAIWTSKALAARMKEHGHSLRIADKDNKAPDVQDEIQKAAGKNFPQVFLNDKSGKLKQLQFDAPLTAADLLKLLENNGG